MCLEALDPDRAERRERDDKIENVVEFYERANAEEQITRRATARPVAGGDGLGGLVCVIAALRGPAACRSSPVCVCYSSRRQGETGRQGPHTHRATGSHLLTYMGL